MHHMNNLIEKNSSEWIKQKLTDSVWIYYGNFLFFQMKYKVFRYSYISIFLKEGLKVYASFFVISVAI